MARDSLRCSWPSTFDLSDLAFRSVQMSSPVDGMSYSNEDKQQYILTRCHIRQNKTVRVRNGIIIIIIIITIIIIKRVLLMCH